MQRQTWDYSSTRFPANVPPSGGMDVHQRRFFTATSLDGRTVTGLPYGLGLEYMSSSSSCSSTLLLNQLLHHPHFSDLCESIWACVSANSPTWNALHHFRTDPHAVLIFRLLGIRLPLLIPDDIWDAIVHLRTDSGWEHLQPNVLAQVERAVDATQWSRGSSQRSSSSMPPNATSLSSGILQTLSSESALGEHSRNTSGNSSVLEPPLEADRIRLPISESWPTTSGWDQSIGNSTHCNGRPSRWAPAGHRCCCPLEPCKYNYRRLGNYENHMRTVHPNYPRHNPYDSLRPLTEPLTHATETHKGVMIPTPMVTNDSPSSVYSEPNFPNGVEAENFGFLICPQQPSTLAERHLSTANAIVPPRHYYGDTGVFMMSTTGDGYVRENSEQSSCCSDDDSDMEESQAK